jgi:mono/diheme cytochrome c family protein
MTQLAWDGSMSNFIRQTIASGRPGTLMPTWSDEFGGPMEPYQIDQLTAFILNWGEDPALCDEDTVVEGVDWPASWEELPEGDVSAGDEAYLAQGCSGCHGVPDADPANHFGVGPHLGDIAIVAATRVNGMSAEQYIYESILNPNEFVVVDCPLGACIDPSQMRLDFGDVLSQQGMADLIAYYMTLAGE